MERFFPTGLLPFINFYNGNTLSKQTEDTGKEKVPSHQQETRRCMLEGGTIYFSNDIATVQYIFKCFEISIRKCRKIGT